MSKADERKAWTDRVVKSEMAASFKTAKSKYSAIKKTVNGQEFHSTKEAKRYLELTMLQAAKQISNLELQPKYDLWITPMAGGAPILAGSWYADFRYLEGAISVVEDVKGMKTPVYRLKKKLVEALYGVTIRET